MRAQEPELEIRLVREDDAFDRLTEILHAAYARLGMMGLKYKAVDQTVNQTRERLELGEGYVFLVDAELAGTVTLMPPAFEGFHPHFSRRDVAVFGQFGIDPALQGRGYGGQVIRFLEGRARALGAQELACDTAVPATHLVDWYARIGYRQVDRVQWDFARYESFILSKLLRSKPA